MDAESRSSLTAPAAAPGEVPVAPAGVGMKPPWPANWEALPSYPPYIFSVEFCALVGACCCFVLARRQVGEVLFDCVHPFCPLFFFGVDSNFSQRGVRFNSINFSSSSTCKTHRLPLGGRYSPLATVASHATFLPWVEMKSLRLTRSQYLCRLSSKSNASHLIFKRHTTLGAGAGVWGE